MKKRLLNFIRKVLGTKRIEKNLSRFRKDTFYESRRNQLIDHILHDKEPGISLERYSDHDIIVSLTTYGKRIYDVAFTIESIMQQSMKANRIILWLDHSFENQPLPQSLLLQSQRGLEINFCTDIRSYTKLVPALRAYPKDAIITIDDDVLYDYDVLENLISAHIQEPGYIQSCRVHRIALGNDGRPISYNDWDWHISEEGVHRLNFQTGVGGVLYPPESLDKEVLNQKIFLDICKFADDVWFYSMALKKGTLVNKVHTRNDRGEDYLLNEAVQDMGLANINTKGEILNDRQIKAVLSKYDLYSRLK